MMQGGAMEDVAEEGQSVLMSRWEWFADWVGIWMEEEG
jgi:hypothetical protein